MSLEHEVASGRDVAYRERVAWLTACTFGLAFVPFFLSVKVGLFDLAALPNLRLLGAYAVTALTAAAIIGVGHVVLRHRYPDEAGLPPDEREVQIERRATQWSYYLLMAGTIWVAGVLPFVASGWHIVIPALGLLVVTVVVQSVAVVVGYRLSR